MATITAVRLALGIVLVTSSLLKIGAQEITPVGGTVVLRLLMLAEAGSGIWLNIPVGAPASGITALTLGVAFLLFHCSAWLGQRANRSPVRPCGCLGDLGVRYRRLPEATTGLMLLLAVLVVAVDKRSPAPVWAAPAAILGSVFLVAFFRFLPSAPPSAEALLNHALASSSLSEVGTAWKWQRPTHATLVASQDLLMGDELVHVQVSIQSRRWLPHKYLVTILPLAVQGWSEMRWQPSPSRQPAME